MYRRAFDRATDVAMLLAEIAIVLMMVHVAFELAVRWLFNSGIAGTYEVVTYYYMVACAYFPLAYVTRGDGHISAQIFTQALPRRARPGPGNDPRRASSRSSVAYPPRSPARSTR